MDIKPGDLVMVVRGTPCCGDCTDMGLPFIVVGILEPQPLDHCSKCYAKATEQGLHGNSKIYFKSRVIKLDPDNLKENTSEPRKLETL